MQILPCPACQSPIIEWLSFLGKTAQVDYYRCLNCAHIWTSAKDQSEKPAVS